MNLRKPLILLLAVGVSMMATAALFGWGGDSWKEEVLLHDGKKIIATRTVDRGGISWFGQLAPIKQQSVAFTLPNTNEKVVWEDKFTEDIGGANFLAMQLEVSQGAAYLVAYPMGCLSYNKWDRPNPPYVVFKYQSKSWQRIPLQELPVVFTDLNLIFSSPDTEAKKSGQAVVSAEVIKALNAGHRQPEHQTILRDPIKPATFQSLVSCNELVFYKGMWVGPGDSIGKQMMDRK